MTLPQHSIALLFGTATANRFGLVSAVALLVSLALTGCQRESGGAKGAAGGSRVTLLNVSYDPTREFYAEVNQAFADQWQQEKGQQVTIEQSHGGSGKQARAVIDGLEADVVTLALAYDIDIIADKGKLLPEDWQRKLPDNSAPYTSTIVFLVRKGNPKKIKSWDDLVKGNVEIITPNPKTSGGARWNYLAAWGSVLEQELGDLKKLSDPAAKAEVEAAQAKAKAFVKQLYSRVPVLDSGARGATNTFVQREIGDVLLAWENEALLAVKELGPDKVEVVVPSVSILAEPPVAVVDKIVDRRGTREAAEAYLKFLYTKQGQELAAQHYYRPALESEVSAEALAGFPNVNLFTIEEGFGGWKRAQKEHFDDGGVFDQIYQPSNAN